MTSYLIRPIRTFAHARNRYCVQNNQPRLSRTDVAWMLYVTFFGARHRQVESTGSACYRLWHDQRASIWSQESNQKMFISASSRTDRPPGSRSHLLSWTKLRPQLVFTWYVDIRGRRRTSKTDSAILIFIPLN